MKNEIGESSRSIVSRCDDAAWPAVEAALLAGGTLYRPPRLPSYYVFGVADDKGAGRSLSALRVKTLEAEGVLKLIGEHRYTLASNARPTST